MLILVAAASAAFLAVVPAASALETNGVDAKEYARGFPVTKSPETGARGGPGVGPIGIGFDNSNRLFVVSTSDDIVYRFDGPGTASTTTALSTPLNGEPMGLALDADDRLYIGRKGASDIVEMDPGSGLVLRRVAQVPCPLALALDPTTGDMFVTLGCGRHQIARVAGPGGPAPVASIYTNLRSPHGLTVAPDGTLYAISREGVTQIEGPNSSDPRRHTRLVDLPGATGVGVAPGSRGRPRALLVTRHSGKITQVDLSGSRPVTTDIVTGATRGDLSTVDADGCYYASMSSSVLRLTNPNGSCAGSLLGGFAPSTPSAGPGNAPQLLPDPPARGCVDTRKFTWRLHHRPDATVTSVDIYVNGKRRVRRRGAKIETVTLKRLPQGTFRVRIVAKHSDGNQIVSKRRYKGCKKGKPRGRRGGRSSR